MLSTTNQMPTLPTTKPNDCPHKDECAFSTPTQLLFRGPLNAEICIIGQGPGRDEVAAQSPFVGPSGQMVDRLLTAAGFDPSTVLFCNSLRCSTTSGTPKIKELSMCRENAWEVAFAYPRKLLIILGNEANCCIFSTPPKGVLAGAGTFQVHKETDRSEEHT